jgi:hypothetical protein
VRRLLKLEQVTGVFLGRDFISVNKREDASWMVRRRGSQARHAGVHAAAVSAGSHTHAPSHP